MWIRIFDQAWNIVPTPIQFSPANTPGKVECIIEDSQPHEYFLHLNGKEFLDVFIAYTNLKEGKIISKGHLGSCSLLETYKNEERLVFLVKQLAWD